MTDEIRGVEPTQVIMDEPVFGVETVRQYADALRQQSRLFADEACKPPRRPSVHASGVFPPLGQVQQPWYNNDLWVKPANSDIRSDAADPGDQTYTHDATVATIPVDVALALCAEHPILQQLIKFHNVEDNSDEPDKLTRGAATDLAISVLDAGHVRKQARTAKSYADVTEHIRALKAEAMKTGLPISMVTQRGVHVPGTENPVNSNPEKSGARARRKAKRKSKRR